MLTLLPLLLGLSLTTAQLSVLQPWLYYQPQPFLPRFSFYQSYVSPEIPDSPHSLATPLRAAVESQPSDLVKAQTRILDLAALQAGHVSRSACTEGHKPGAVCSEFFVCVHEKWSLQTCPDGLHWDNNNKNCAWPDQAGCEGGQTQEEDSDSTGVISAPEPSKPEIAPVVAEFPEWENPPTPSTTPFTTPSTTPATSTTTQDWNKPWQPPTPPPRPDYDNLPLTNGLSGDYKIVCYFTNWATYRQTGGGKFDPEDIDPKICTHIIYGFAVLDGNTLLMKSHDPYADMSDGESLTGV